MGQYVFKHPTLEKYVEVVQRMNEKHIYIDSEGIEYERVWRVPQMAMDLKMDPFSKNDFLKRMNKRCKVGDMMDESAELSEKRAKIAGKDPLKEKIFTDYEKKTGHEHPESISKNIETSDFSIELD